MKPSELRQQGITDLKALLGEKRKRLEELKFLSYRGKAKNVKEASAVKKDIARIKTIVKEAESNK